MQTLQTDSALRILTRMGYIEYVEEMEYASRVHFIINREELYKLRNLPQEYETLITALLRNYSGLFTDYAFIDERYLARVTKLTRHRMYEILVSLSQKRIIQYAPSKRCPIVTFTRHRVLGEELRFAPEVYEERKAAFEERIASMLKYATSATECRSSMLLRYFGEKNVSDCGVCDICIARKGGKLSAANMSNSRERLFALLADGEPHAPSEILSLGFTDKQMSELLRHLCDEEKISIVDGRVVKK